MDICRIAWLILAGNIPTCMLSLVLIPIYITLPLQIMRIRSISVSLHDLSPPLRVSSDQLPPYWITCQVKFPSKRRQVRPVATCTQSGSDQPSLERIIGLVQHFWICKTAGVKLKLVEDFTSSFPKMHQTFVESQTCALQPMKEDMLSRKVVFMFTISTVENVTRVILKDKRCVQRSFYVAYISRVRNKASFFRFVTSVDEKFSFFSVVVIKN